MPLTTNLHRSVLIQHSQHAFLLWNFPLTYTFWRNVNGSVFFLHYQENFILLLFQGFPVTKEKFKQIDVFPEFSSGRKRTTKEESTKIPQEDTNCIALFHSDPWNTSFRVRDKLSGTLPHNISGYIKASTCSITKTTRNPLGLYTAIGGELDTKHTLNFLACSKE